MCEENKIQKDIEMFPDSVKKKLLTTCTGCGVGREGEYQIRLHLCCRPRPNYSKWLSAQHSAVSNTNNETYVNGEIAVSLDT